MTNPIYGVFTQLLHVILVDAEPLDQIRPGLILHRESLNLQQIKLDGQRRSPWGIPISRLS